MTGCGISGEVLDNVPEQVKSFLMIHIYLTVRKILFEMGGIQSESALPGDPTFSQIIIIMICHRSNEYAQNWNLTKR